MPRLTLPVLPQLICKFSFDTLVLENSSGAEQRNGQSTEYRFSCDFSDLVFTKSEYEELRDFFDDRKGKLEGFRFKNWADYKVTKDRYFPEQQDVFYSQGILKQISGNQYQLLKKYGIDGEGAAYKTITKPVQNTVLIYANNTLLTNLTINYETGIVTINGTVSGNLTWSGEFDLWVRFDSDELSVIELDGNYYQFPNGTLSEIVTPCVKAYGVEDFRDTQKSIDIGVITPSEITTGYNTIVEESGKGFESRIQYRNNKQERIIQRNVLYDEEKEVLAIAFINRRGKLLSFTYRGEYLRFDTDTLSLQLLTQDRDYTLWEMGDISLVAPSEPLPSFVGGQCLNISYRVTVRTKVIWRRLAQPKDVLSVRYMDVTKTIPGRLFGTRLDNTDWNSVPDGFSFFGGHYTYVTRGSGQSEYYAGVGQSGANDYTDLDSVTELDGTSFDDTPGINCEARAVSAEIISVTRVDGQPDSCGNKTNGSDILSFCQCAKITRRDGEVLGFTSHDCDLEVDGVIYKASSALSATAVAQKSDLSTDNIELKSFISDDSITDEELIAGIYDEAEVVVSAVDFLDLPDTIEEGIVLASGSVGEVRATPTNWNMEVRSLSSKLNQGISVKSSPICTYRFCNKKCGLDEEDYSTETTVTGINTRAMGVDLDLTTNDYQHGYLEFLSGKLKGARIDIKGNSGEDTVDFTELVPTGVEIGDDVRLVKGCAKSPEACQSYNNYDNFGGFPSGGNWMPGIDSYIKSPD